MNPLKQSQTQALIRLMKRRWITQLEALRECGCSRLAARIWDLERFHRIERRWVERGNKRFMAYRIV